jgi:hypothetical protein
MSGDGREQRALQRKLAAVQTELKALKQDRKEERVRLKAEADKELEAQEREAKKVRMTKAMLFLHEKNWKGDAHTNFHGISEAQRVFDIPATTLKDNYKIYKSQQGKNPPSSLHFTSTTASAARPPVPSPLPPLFTSHTSLHNTIAPLSLPLALPASTNVPLLALRSSGSEGDTFIQGLLDRIVGGEKKGGIWLENEATLNQCGYKRSTFLDLVQRRMENPDAPLRLKRGRGDVVDPALLQQLRDDGRVNDLKGDSSFRLPSGDRNAFVVAGWDPSEVEGSFQKRLKDAQLALNPTSVPRTFSESAMRSIEKRVFQATPLKGDKSGQNERRYQAMNDAFNAFALAIIYLFTEMLLGRPVKPQFHINTDQSSSLIGKVEMQKILTKIGSKEELNELHRSPTVVKKGGGKQRGISYSVAIDHKDSLIALTTHLKDHSFNGNKEVSTYRLSEKCFLQTIPTEKGGGSDGDDNEGIMDMEIESTTASVSGSASTTVEAGTVDDDDDVDQLPQSDRFDTQKAIQYVNRVVIQRALETREAHLIAEHHSTKNAATPLSSQYIQRGLVGNFRQQIPITSEEKLALEKKALEPENAIMLAVDGEKQHLDIMLDLFMPPPALPISPPPALTIIPLITTTTTTTTTSTSHSNSVQSDESSPASFSSVPLPVLSQSSRMEELNIIAIKYSASCSKTQQIADVVRRGFAGIHQFLGSEMFDKFNPDTATQPSYMPAVEVILQNVPAASRKLFTKALVIMEALTLHAFSASSISKGAIATGAITNGADGNFNIARVLTNCPTIKLVCEKNKTIMPILIGKCKKIAEEMYAQKLSGSPEFKGTPSDLRMEQEFGEWFGNIHIGNRATSSGNDVTVLAFNRWRAAFIGCSAQIKMKPIPPSSSSTSTIPPFFIQQLLSSSGSASSVPTGSSDTETSSATTTTTTTTTTTNAQKRKGPKCGNIDCPDGARYYKESGQNWTKCAGKSCNKCVSGGCVKVCANAQCKAILAAHMAA